MADFIVAFMNYLLTTLLFSCLAFFAACAQHSQAETQGAKAGAQTTKTESNLQTSIPANPQSAIRNPQSPDSSKFALIISGLSGEESYAKQFDKWTNDLRAALTERLAFAPDHVIVLNEKATSGAARSTAEEVKKAFAALRTNTSADSRVFIFFIGHGTFDNKIARFNLVGADLSGEEYAPLLKNLPTRNLVIINTASASGEFIKPLSAQGRIIITATRSGQEQNATHFAEYFIAALSGKKEDAKAAVNADAEAVSAATGFEADTDKNGRVSVLEAFDYAVKLVNDFYNQQGRLITEHALLDDNGDGTGHAKAEAGDGALAKVTYFDSLPAQLARGDEELKKFFAEKARLEGEVEQLKARKEQMKEEEYEAALEKLLIELAQVNQKIKAKQK